MYRNDNCFGCGSDNPMGLHLKVEQQDEGRVVTHFVCEPKHAGWPGIQHGGVTSALLDEVSGYVPNFMGVMTMTAELKISYRDPIYVGEHLEIQAEPIRVTRRLIDVAARIVNHEGAVKAESLAKMVVLTAEQRRAAGLKDVEME
ncbi:PaaI family thioesterase [Alicyclobacillus ferrooxydans]|uniref:Acyl-coenzyme A thioesterase THEM4 n=1 Tax=Alicyclobacillus ferrooxydans TaxID=471514 RepID=A0A0P9CZS5_9BACL|nr:PaaI family thioesterase [Alicyclobacillus ferrooxydans]KPV45235.1 hypothetical protein AN477_02190 [Alicyclobacillus ferrooxydans]